MKKQIIIGLCACVVTACSTNPYSSNETLADMFVWGAKKQVRQQPQNVRQIVINQDIDDVEVVEIPVDEVETETEIETERYSFAKRGDRYELATHTTYNITPQVYGIVAGRAVNKMLLDAPAIFAANKNAPLFIAETQNIDRYLPTEPDTAGKTAKEIITGSKMFNLVDSKEKAAYVLESTLNNVNTPEIPVIVYELTLLDAKGKKLGQWSDSIRQVQNDDGSWW